MAETSEMIERVARGLARLRVEQNMRYPDFYGEPMTKDRIAVAVDHGWPNFTAEAEAAIRAMREPSDAMVTAFCEAMNEHAMVEGPAQLAAPCFQAMINAALPSPPGNR